MDNNTGRIIFWHCKGCGRENKVYPDKRIIEVDGSEHDMTFISGKELFKNNPYYDLLTSPVIGRLTGTCACGHSIELPVLEGI